jgi:hypothetical protein
MNDLYTIDCTGDAVTGDEVKFEQAQFAGSFRNPRFIGTKTVTGKIIRDSYGAAKQQHTFTLLLEDGSTLRIKGRNLYRNGTMRKPWADETARQDARTEKHQRGDAARATRQLIRSMDSLYSYAY